MTRRAFSARACSRSARFLARKISSIISLGPSLVELFMQIGQCAQKMGIAQAVAAVAKGELGPEAVVDEQVLEARQDSHTLHGFATALGVEMVEGRLIGA